MAFCRFMPSSSMFMATPVDNIFFEEYMPRATGDNVKVYLYGLMHCASAAEDPLSIDDMARALGMTSDDVRAAYIYWQQQGLVRVRIDGDGMSVFYMILPRDTSSLDMPKANRFADFNAIVNALFAPRMLNPSELDVMHGWIDELGFTPESASLVAEYSIKRQGNRVPIYYMDTVAKGWAEQGLVDAGSIHSYIAVRDDIAPLFKRLGIRGRMPTQAEIELYNKWTAEWGFESDAIEYASELAGTARNPSFKYMDGILARMRGDGALTRADMEAASGARLRASQAASEVMEALGLHGAPSPTLIAMISDWRANFGYDMPVILLAAEHLASRGVRNPSVIGDTLAGWSEDGLISYDDVIQRLDSDQRLSNDAKTLFRRLLIERSPQTSDMAQLSDWTNELGMPFETILTAAGYITDRKLSGNRMTRLGELLLFLHDRGAVSPDAALNVLSEITAIPQSGRYADSRRDDRANADYPQRSDDLEDLYMEF